jgi:hypothetical protein
MHVRRERRGLAAALQTAIASARAEVLTSGDVIPTELERIARLEKLVAHDRAPRMRPGAATLGAAVTAAIVLGLVLSLQSTRIAQTTVDLVARASDVELTVAADARLPGFTRLTWLRITGLESYRPPATCPGGPAPVQADALELTAASPGTLEFSAYDVPRETTVWFMRRAAQHIGLRVLAPTGQSLNEHAVGADGAFTLVDSMGRRCRTIGPQLVAIRPTRALSLQAETTASAPIQQSAELPVRRLGFDRSPGDTGATRWLSTLRDGTIYATDLSGWERKLRSHQRVRVTVLDGSMSDVRVDGQELAVVFSGRVSDIQTGNPEHLRSLMPTRLEQISRDVGLVLLWSAFSFGVAVLGSAFAWWRGMRK